MCSQLTSCTLAIGKLIQGQSFTDQALVLVRTLRHQEAAEEGTVHIRRSTIGSRRQLLGLSRQLVRLHSTIGSILNSIDCNHNQLGHLLRDPLKALQQPAALMKVWELLG